MVAQGAPLLARAEPDTPCGPLPETHNVLHARPMQNAIFMVKMAFQAMQQSASSYCLNSILCALTYPPEPYICCGIHRMSCGNSRHSPTMVSCSSTKGMMPM